MYKHIKDDSNFYDLALELSEGGIKEVFCDLETTGLDARLNRILTWQIMAGEDIYIYDFTKLNNEHLKYLINLLETTKVKSVFHNTKFDIKFLAHHGGKWMKNLYDTMNAEVLINAGLGKSVYGLKELALNYCGVELKKDDRDMFFKNGEVHEITEQMLQYGAMDVQVLRGIYEQQMDKIGKAKETKILDIEMNLLPVIANMEYNGVLIDRQSWQVLEDKEKVRLEKTITELKDLLIDTIDLSKYNSAVELATACAIPIKTKKALREAELLTTKETMRAWYDLNVNMNSPKQLKTSLNLVGIDVDSVDKKVLNKLEKSPIINCLLDRSEASKRISTYGSGVFDFINPISGRIHTEFLDMGTATGRLSSGNPINLQNIPNATGYRESFISAEDYLWLSADYSQQEFRLTGSVTREPVIIDAYIKGADMHIATATLIYKRKMAEITKQERYVGKTANFTIIYGGTEYALQKNLSLSKNVSEEILDAFYSGYPVLATFKKAAEEAIVKLGFSTTVLGRRRYNIKRPLYQTNNEYLKYISKVKREGFNHIIQGTAADITKIAMINIYNNNPFGDKLKMLIQVHDELDFEAHKTIIEDAKVFVRQEMLNAEQPFLGEIPAEVDIKVGEHWIH